MENNNKANDVKKKGFLSKVPTPVKYVTVGLGCLGLGLFGGYKIFGKEVVNDVIDVVADVTEDVVESGEF